jgi:hypothetical protein
MVLYNCLIFRFVYTRVRVYTRPYLQVSIQFIERFALIMLTAVYLVEADSVMPRLLWGRAATP